MKGRSGFSQNHWGGASPLAALLLWMLLGATVFGQRQVESPPPLDPAQGRKEARALVTELLAQRPEENVTNSGRVKIRDREGQEIEMPARFEVVCTPSNWVSVYETLSSGGSKLIITHTSHQPNEYLLQERSNAGDGKVVQRRLKPGETMVPFAGSDFWVADLGLEFLHWPEQRVVKKAMRHSKFCYVLESSNSAPTAGGYARVESWIIPESPYGMVHAEAYGADDKLIKVFDPVNLEKVRGDYQLEEMEMRNRKTGSHTWIKFDVGRE